MQLNLVILWFQKVPVGKVVQRLIERLMAKTQLATAQVGMFALIESIKLNGDTRPFLIGWGSAFINFDPA